MARPNRQSQRTTRLRLDRIVGIIIITVGAFYAGVLVGMHSAQQQPRHDFTNTPEFDRAVRARVQQALVKKQETQKEEHHDSELRFGQATSRYALGAARIPKQDFLDTFDNGFPSDQNDDPLASEVLIFYNSHKALPELRGDETILSAGMPPKLTALDATQNCHALHVVSTQAGNAMPQCIAIVPQYQSFHVQRWMRIDPPSSVDSKLPLVPVGRGQMPQGVNQFEPPRPRAVQMHWKQLQRHLSKQGSFLDELRPILKKVAIQKTVIVMVCNRGQADLLANFACTSKARGLTVSNVLVFCTDQETHTIAIKLGMTAYYEDNMFLNVFSEQAKTYGDKVFQAMMHAKVVTVQLVNWLGYNVLFQDVDVVWYKNPLDYLETSYTDFDVLFQDDGARSLRYAPYSANSGFYYVRYNARTRHLLTSMLYMGDMIVASGSHQQALAVLLAEHASLYGLRVKTLEARDFVSGYSFHRQPELMREICQTKTHEPYIFHASWTENKDNKILFLQQMGLWYLNGDESCAKEPIIACHYRDKPSVIPCHDSPPLDKNKPSFWK